MAAVGSRRIGEIFLEKGLVTEEQLGLALEVQSRTGKRLGEVLVELGLIERLAIADALGLQWSTLSAPGRHDDEPDPATPTVEEGPSAAPPRPEARELGAWKARAEASERETERLRALVAELSDRRPDADSTGRDAEALHALVAELAEWKARAEKLERETARLRHLVVQLVAPSDESDESASGEWQASERELLRLVHSSPKKQQWRPFRRRAS
jgi:type IV pilus assembly protein PilB